MAPGSSTGLTIFLCELMNHCPVLERFLRRAYLNPFPKELAQRNHWIDISFLCATILLSTAVMTKFLGTSPVGATTTTLRST